MSYENKSEKLQYVLMIFLTIVLFGLIVGSIYMIIVANAPIAEDNTTAMLTLPGYSDETVSVQVKEWKWISDSFIRITGKNGTVYYAYEKNVLFVRDGGE